MLKPQRKGGLILLKMSDLQHRETEETTTGERELYVLLHNKTHINNIILHIV